MRQMRDKVWRFWRAVRWMALLTALAVLASAVPETAAKYAFTITQDVTVTTADLHVSHTGAARTIVYSAADAVRFLVSNTGNGSAAPDGHDISYQVSIHAGDGQNPPDLTAAHPDFMLTVNNDVCDERDTSNVFLMPGGSPVTQEINLFLQWGADYTMALSTFVYVKIAVVSPYEKEYVFPVTVLAKRMISLTSEIFTDAFSNQVTRLTMVTADSFGAGPSDRRMLVTLSWDEALAIDDTNALIARYKDIPGDLNAQSVVNGGGRRVFLILLEPSSFCQLNFYRVKPTDGAPPFIGAGVWLDNADQAYYGLWDCRRGEQDGWDKPPDGPLYFS